MYNLQLIIFLGENGVVAEAFSATLTLALIRTLGPAYQLMGPKAAPRGASDAGDATR